MTPESLPLTQQMRAALLEHRARNNRLLVRGGLALAAFVGILTACLLPTTGDAFPYIALLVLCFLATPIILGAVHVWGNHSRVRRALAEGTYRHYVGPPHIAPPARGQKFAMILGDDRLPLDLRTEQAEPILAQERVTAVYSVAAQAIFAIWDQQGRVIHQYADYDLRSDKELVAPGAGDGRVPEGSRAAAPATARAQAGRHPVAPGRYPLTPQMRARLDPNGGWPWQIVAMMLVPAAIGGIFHYLGAPPGIFLSLYGASVFLLGLLFVTGRTVDQQHAAMQAAGTYARYVGFYELRYKAGSTRSGIQSPGNWYLHAQGATFRLWGSLDSVWLEEGQKRGTLIYSPEMEYLFAAWDETGRLTYRARHYDLDGDALVAVPAPE